MSSSHQAQNRQDPIKEKAALRIELRESLGNFSKDENSWKRANLALRQSLLEFLQPQSSYWGVFYPLKTEPQILGLGEALKNIHWLYPRIQNEEMIWLLPGVQGFELGPFGTQ